SPSPIVPPTASAALRWLCLQCSWAGSNRRRPQLASIDAGLLEVALDHVSNELRKACARPPVKFSGGERCVAAQLVDLRWPEIALVDFDVVLPVEPDHAKGRLGEFLHAVHLAGSDDVVSRVGLLEHPPYRLY